MPLLSPAFQRAIKVEMLSNALSKKILEMSARARAEEVQREATRKASHQVTGVFNSLLAARHVQQESNT